jgi:hypothetical protein
MPAEIATAVAARLTATPTQLRACRVEPPIGQWMLSDGWNRVRATRWVLHFLDRPLLHKRHCREHGKRRLQ